MCYRDSFIRLDCGCEIDNGTVFPCLACMQKHHRWREWQPLRWLTDFRRYPVREFATAMPLRNALAVIAATF